MCVQLYVVGDVPKCLNAAYRSAYEACVRTRSFPLESVTKGVRHPIGAPGMTPAGLVQARQQQAGQIAQMVVVYHTTSYLRSVGIVCIP